MSDEKEGVTSHDKALQLIHSAIVKILETDVNIDAVFGSPVDTSLLPDYDILIEYPRDLGTISQSIEESLAGRGPYRTYGEVLADVQLVWRNCLRYNNRPEDVDIVALCGKARDMFKTVLRDVCAASGVWLVDAPVHALLDEPLRFSSEDNKGVLPRVDIDDFEIMSKGNNEMVDLLVMGELRNADETVLLSGLPVQGIHNGGSEKMKRIRNEPVLDWAIDRSITCVDIWVITKNAWYRLRSPSKRYGDVYQHVLDGVETIEAAIDIAELQEDVDVKYAVTEAMKNTKGKRKMSAIVRNFAVSHLQALYGQRREKYSTRQESQGLEEDPNYEAISDDDIPEDFEVDDEDFDIDECDTEEFEKARKKAWRRNKYNVQKQRDEEIMESKLLEAEIQGHEGRGSPPEMSTSLRLPSDKLHNVLFLWSFLQEFGDVLRLPPFSFQTLEAALCPGPHVSVMIREHEEAMREQQRKSSEPQTTLQVECNEQNTDAATTEPKPMDLVAEKNDTDLGMKAEIKLEGECTGSDMKISQQQTVVETNHTIDDGNVDSGGKHPVSSQGVIAGNTVDVEMKNTMPSFSNEQPQSTSEHVPGADKGHSETEIPPVKIKRGRGRPRKDGSAPQPRPFVGLPKVAPQNLVLDPTVRTRRQRGVTVTSKLLDEYALDIDEILKDEDYRLPKHRKKMVKPKPQALPFQTHQSGDGANKIFEAIKNSQKIQEEYEANLKRKYGINSDVLKFGSPVDKNHAPSSVLLRDIVLALLGVIDETLPPFKKDFNRPLSASAYLPPRNQKSIWPEAAANNVWSWNGIWEEAKDAALHLAYGDFVDLSVDQKIEILSGLLYEAIESKFISGELSKRADRCLQQQATRAAFNCSKRHGIDLAANILSEIENEGDGDADTSVGPAKSLKGWMRWVDFLGLGAKACIGEDLSGRRYWALGKEAGAFRIFCQEIKVENGVEFDTWGWYEGSQLTALVGWLKSTDIRVERPLIAALSTAPYPTDSLPTKSWKKSDLENQRADGYRNISQPLLKGEWNHCDGKPLPLTMDQRVSQAIESILGSISFWFEERELSKRIFAVSDILLSSQPKASARALLEADKLLTDAGKVTEEWVDIWSPKWRISVTSMMDVRDVALHIAALQSHVIMQADVIPRGTYMKLLEDFNCILTIPLPSDKIAVMKTGILQHIDKSIELLGLEHDDHAPEESLRIENSKSDSAMAPALDADVTMLPLKQSSRASVKSKWMKLREDICGMKYIQQYTVRGIVYRRHIVDSEHVNSEGFTKEEAALLRKPIVWLYLKPIEYAIESQLASKCIMAPIIIDKGLEDYFVPLDDFKKRMSVDWCNNDRFKYFVAPTPAQRRSKNVGYWKKGTVVENSLECNPMLDPWESVIVEFDNTPVGETTKASPWKLEIDPDEEKAMVEEARKMEQAVARSQRARSSSRSENADEARLQEAEWAEEDNQLQLTLKQAKRSEHLLQIHNSSSHYIAGEIHNEVFYGVEEKAKYYNYLSEIGNELYIKYFALASKNRSKGDARTVNNSFPSGPLVPGQQIDPKILEALRLLTRDQFLLMLKNFYVGLKGKFKIPIFAHKELDLFVVWWSVIERYGYETVTTHKQWKDICRSLHLDLSGQTSASFNMRMNYERCLLDFENYLACGQYDIDLAANKAPVHTHIMDPSTTRFYIPGAYEDQMEYMDTPLVSSLPSEDDTAKEPDTSPKADQNEADGSKTNVSTKISLKGAFGAPKSSVIKLKQPPQASQDPDGASQENPGAAIKSRGSAAIGMSVELFWPSEGGWWRAEIVNFDPTTQNHQILYNQGQADESFEWIDMASLGSQEIRFIDKH